MRNQFKFLIFSGLVFFLVMVCFSGKGWTKSSNEKKRTSGRLQQRIDFGNSYIMGQSIKSGAVYLLHRKQSDIKSMLHYRKEYRDEILEHFIIKDDEKDSAMGQKAASSN